MLQRWTVKISQNTDINYSLKNLQNRPLWMLDFIFVVWCRCANVAQAKFSPGLRSHPLLHSRKYTRQNSLIRRIDSSYYSLLVPTRTTVLVDTVDWLVEIAMLYFGEASYGARKKLSEKSMAEFVVEASFVGIEFLVRLIGKVKLDRFRVYLIQT